MKRLITHKEEAVYRCRHHEFGSMTTKETAERLEISEATVRKIMRNLEKKFPQLFPVLTRDQVFLEYCIISLGLTHQEIAKLLGISKIALTARVMRLKAKGVFLERPKRSLQYENWQDKHVKQKF